MNLFIVEFLIFFVKGYAYTQDNSVHNELDMLDAFSSTIGIEEDFTNVDPIAPLYDDSKTIRIIELTDRYPSNRWDLQKEIVDHVTVKAEEGYSLAVSILQCSLGESYIRISSNENFTTDNTLTFAYDVQEHYTYFFNTNIIYIKINTTIASSKFVAYFSRFGQKFVPTTTSIPTTTIVLPTPQSNESSEITVYITGTESSEFWHLETFNALRESILQMAKRYCEEQEFILAENITLNNIIVKVLRCTENWPDVHKCVQVRFKIPIQLKDDSPWKGYQLNSAHLRIMWDNYSSEYLPSGMQVRILPNMNTIIDWQLVIAVCVIIVFGILLLALRYACVVIPDKLRKRRASDTASILSNGKKSEMSLPPYYLQEPPPIFDHTPSMFEPMDDPGFAQSIEFADFRKTPENDTISETSEIIDESGA